MMNQNGPEYPGCFVFFFMEKAEINKNFFELIDFLVSKKYKILIIKP